jgi:glycosyltransferase involved in cell wall biosynthesis
MSIRTNIPRILYVTPFWPFKGVTGVHVRSLNLLRALQQIGTIEVMVLGDEYIKRERISEMDRDLVVHSLEVKPEPNKGLIEKLRWTFDPRSNYPNGCGVGAQAMQRVLGRLNEFDLIWFFKPRSADMFPNAVWPCSVLDIDDVPSSYERSTMQAGAALLERFFTLRRLFVWKRREKLLGGRFTVLTVCSEEDKQYLRRIGLKSPIHVIPNGFEKPSVEPVRSPAKPPRIGFIGVLDYFPNREGIHWFVNNCWPRIKCAVPDARLRLVGPGSDGPFKPVGPDVDGLGWLANPSDEIKTWSLMAVPIRAGGGTRVKIAQGFSEKCPIVSTSLGAHGYQPRDGHEMYLADSAEAFSNACIKTIREPDKAAQMAERAWCQYLEKWTWEAIYPRVWAAAEDCLRLSGQNLTPIPGKNARTGSAATPVTG